MTVKFPPFGDRRQNYKIISFLFTIILKDFEFIFISEKQLFPEQGIINLLFYTFLLIEELSDLYL